MITLRFTRFPGADVTSYKVYCSIIGFRAPIPLPGVLDGKTLTLKMHDSEEQTITFDATSVIDQINSTLLGGHAYPLIRDPGYFYLRADVRDSSGSVEIIDGTALTDLGLVPRMIIEKSEDFLIAQLPVLANPDASIEFEDPDGVCQDWYSVTTVSSQGNESTKAPYKQPVTHSGRLCVLEGIVTNLQGVRIPDAEIVAKLIKYPQEPSKASQISMDPVSTLTSSDGRFSLAILQGAHIQLEIPLVGFSRAITVPNKPCEFITDILVDLDYRYPLEYY
jgi:hypothetical protein